MTNQRRSGRWKLPNALRPAQMTNTPISEMWPTNPATVLSPTADTDTARSTPDFWRKRTLSAIPPTLAGASLLANSEATWLTTSGPARTCDATAPARPAAAPMYVISAISATSGAQAQLASRIWRKIPGRSASCGQQEVGGGGEDRHHQDRLLVDPLELDEVDLGDAGLGAAPRAAGRRAGPCARAARCASPRSAPAAGGGAARWRRRRVRAPRSRTVTGRGRAGDDRQGGEDLGDVGVEHAVVDRQLGEAEVDEPRATRRRRRTRWPCAGRDGRCGGDAAGRPRRTARRSSRR